MPVHDYYRQQINTIRTDPERDFYRTDSEIGEKASYETLRLRQVRFEMLSATINMLQWLYEVDEDKLFENDAEIQEIINLNNSPQEVVEHYRHYLKQQSRRGWRGYDTFTGLYEQEPAYLDASYKIIETWQKSRLALTSIEDPRNFLAIELAGTEIQQFINESYVEKQGSYISVETDKLEPNNGKSITLFIEYEGENIQIDVIFYHKGDKNGEKENVEKHERNHVITNTLLRALPPKHEKDFAQIVERINSNPELAKSISSEEIDTIIAYMHEHFARTELTTTIADISSHLIYASTSVVRSDIYTEYLGQMISIPLSDFSPEIRQTIFYAIKLKIQGMKPIPKDIIDITQCVEILEYEGVDLPNYKLMLTYLLTTTDTDKWQEAFVNFGFKAHLDLLKIAKQYRDYEWDQYYIKNIFGVNVGPILAKQTMELDNALKSLPQFGDARKKFATLQTKYKKKILKAYEENPELRYAKLVRDIIWQETEMATNGMYDELKIIAKKMEISDVDSVIAQAKKILRQVEQNGLGFEQAILELGEILNYLTYLKNSCYSFRYPDNNENLNAQTST